MKKAKEIHTFAMLFELPDRQLLVTKCEDDEGLHAIEFRTTTYRGHNLAIKVGFKSFEAREAGWAKVDKDRAIALITKAPGIDL